MPFMTYTQLKNSAKMRMKPVMGKLIGAAAIQIGITFVITETSSIPSLFSSSPALQAVLYFLLTVLGGTLSGMLKAGSHYLFLKLYCGRPVSTGDLFYTFTYRTKTCIGLSFVMSLMATVPIMPAQYFSLRLGMMMKNMNLAAVSSDITASAVTLPPEALNTLSLAIFCYTPALIVTTLLALTYSQVYYLMLDFPSYSLKELLQKSRRLMRGQKGRLFYIQVCFLPLLFLGIMTCGIGILWILPFMYAVQTEFYLDLVTKRSLRNTPAR